jgi:hypothetical protein
VVVDAKGIVKEAVAVVRKKKMSYGEAVPVDANVLTDSICSVITEQNERNFVTVDCLSHFSSCNSLKISYMA